MAEDAATRNEYEGVQRSAGQIPPQHSGSLLQYVRLGVQVGAICNEQMPLQERLLRCMRYARQITPAAPLLLAIFQPPHQIEAYVATPSAEELEVRSIAVEPPQWAQLHAPAPSLPAHTLALFHLPPLEKPVRVIPLLSDGESLGFLVCTGADDDPQLAVEQQVLELVGHLLAMTIKKEKLAQLVGNRNDQIIREFITDLLTESAEVNPHLFQAHQLGFDFTRPHAVVLAELIRERDPESETVEDHLEVIHTLVERVKFSIQERLPGTLLLRQENRLTCLIPLANEETQAISWLREVALSFQKPGIRLYLGMSGTCRVSGEYPQGAREAEEALQLAKRLHPDGGMTHIEDLGILRYLNPRLLSATVPFRDDALGLGVVARIFELDEQTGYRRRLLNTLEIFLEEEGSLHETSLRLQVHRNTIQQRLTALNEEVFSSFYGEGFNISKAKERWMNLRIAIQLYRLQHPQTGEP